MKNLVTIIALFLSSLSFGQENDTKIEIIKNAFYFELGGNGGIYSFNYDRVVLSGKRTHLSLRGGVSVDHFTYIVPLEINLLFGKLIIFLS